MSELRILEAYYGTRGVYMDVARRLQSCVVDESIVIQGRYNRLFGADPVQGVKKILRVRFELDGLIYEIELPEDMTATLPSDTDGYWYNGHLEQPISNE